MMWHKRLEHVSMAKLHKTQKAKVVLGLPMLKQCDELFCLESPVGKQIKTSHKGNDQGFSKQVLELLHLDLMGPMQVDSLGGKAHVKKNHSVNIVIGEIDRGIVTRKKTKPNYAKMLANIFKNKTDEKGNVTRNKAHLVAQGYSQIKGVDFEEVYVGQPKGFEDPTYLDHVHKLKKAMYDKQAPRAWYDCLSVFLLEQGFAEGGVQNEYGWQTYLLSGLSNSASHPNIVYVVGVCARYQADPHESHIRCAKRILKYVLGIVDFMIRYSFDTITMLVGYYDVDWVGCADDKKSTSDEPVTFSLWARMTAFKIYNSQFGKEKAPQNYVRESSKKHQPSHVSAADEISAHHDSVMLMKLLMIYSRSLALNPYMWAVPLAVYLSLQVTSGLFLLPLLGMQKLHMSEMLRLQQRVISPKARRQKLPPNVPSVPIDEISFHSKECVFQWKYVMKHQITDESIVFYQLHSCAVVIDLIAKAGMMCTVNNFVTGS
ncbi:gag-pol polyprotein [Cucumis melo var. makuwa]|uniref:Gag-pol polyprotein n=1 Tax=Cucumis melo var. makuwa TaxID=1194695 RepID=A0A5A7VN01_CUCMM|nr:gag-pol polyprotein [Cucumis melo var. makuwa]TYK26014.1 gag-pol polyprotein [Cucumis melo var. makuwa]